MNDYNFYLENIFRKHVVFLDANTLQAKILAVFTDTDSDKL